MTKTPAGHDKPRVQVVVTCTQRKNHPVPPSLQMRNVPGARLSTRFGHWTKRLNLPSQSSHPAIDVYAGEHWTVARRLACTRSATNIDLWVCSAGYGLIPAETRIAPYSATFAVGEPDTVLGPATAWWDALGEWEGPVGGVRSLAALAAADPSARLILVLSASYLRACREDVRLAVEKSAAGRLSILSVGTKGDRDLADVLLPADARLQHALGGSRQALNVRAAAHLLDAGLESHEAMRAGIEGLLAGRPPLARYERRRLSDAQLRSLIRRRLRADRTVAHTRLLREFRDAGYACEQGRFASLFHAETMDRQSV